MGMAAEYDPRYLAGIQHFNRREFFEAHEVWEDLWRECRPEDRRFYQGLIQAAVALHHWGNGNWRGTHRLFHSGRTYMSAYPVPYQGLDIGSFWREMEQAIADVLKDAPPGDSARLDPARAPTIALDPLPARWPAVGEDATLDH
jgi:predicted metal-dependent hydrolase